MRNLLTLAALGGAAYWASKQPGGIQGTLGRAKQSAKDIMAGQNPREVGQRFISGRTEEPAGIYVEEPGTVASQGNYVEPYRDYVTGV